MAVRRGGFKQFISSLRRLGELDHRNQAMAVEIVHYPVQKMKVVFPGGQNARDERTGDNRLNAYVPDSEITPAFQYRAAEIVMQKIPHGSGIKYTSRVMPERDALQVVGFYYGLLDRESCGSTGTVITKEELPSSLISAF